MIALAVNISRREELGGTLAAIDAAITPSGDGLLAFDEQCRYVYWNAAMARITGITAAETVGRVAFDVFPFQREDGLERSFQAALAGNVSVVNERPFSIPDTGREGFYEAFYSPLRIDGEVRGGVAVVRDITERTREAEKLRETEARFKNMADASPVLLWMSGTDGLCNFFNQTWLEFTGRPIEKEWGVGWADGVHFEDFQRCMDTYLGAFNERRSFEMEYRLRRRDGAFRWILDRGVPRYSPDGTFAGYIGSCVDITERRHLEGELRDAVRARDDFLLVAAHELRTPLTPIRLTVDMLLRNARRSPSGLHASLPRIEALSQHVTRQIALVEQLLDVSRLAHGPVSMDATHADLAEIVRLTVREYEEVARRAGSDLRMSVPDALPRHFDPSRLAQVVRNLLSNAVKYGRGKPIVLTVEERAEGLVRIEVVDQGIGISAADRARIFGRFERAVSVQQFGGFGLGLWITRQLVEAMGGTISVESELGAGARFMVDLPCIEVKEDRQPTG